MRTKPGNVVAWLTAFLPALALIFLAYVFVPDRLALGKAFYMFYSWIGGAVVGFVALMLFSRKHIVKSIIGFLGLLFMSTVTLAATVYLIDSGFSYFALIALAIPCLFTWAVWKFA